MLDALTVPTNNSVANAAPELQVSATRLYNIWYISMLLSLSFCVSLSHSVSLSLSLSLSLCLCLSLNQTKPNKFHTFERVHKDRQWASLQLTSCLSISGTGTSCGKLVSAPRTGNWHKRHVTTATSCGIYSNSKERHPFGIAPVGNKLRWCSTMATGKPLSYLQQEKRKEKKPSVARWLRRYRKVSMFQSQQTDYSSPSCNFQYRFSS